MPFLVNYINQCIMIHFGEFISSAKIEVYANDEDATINIKSWEISNIDFISLPFKAQKGHYQVKLDFNNHEYVKKIIV